MKEEYRGLYGKELQPFDMLDGTRTGLQISFTSVTEKNVLLVNNVRLKALMDWLELVPTVGTAVYIFRQIVEDESPEKPIWENPITMDILGAFYKDLSGKVDKSKEIFFLLEGLMEYFSNVANSEELEHQIGDTKISIVTYQTFNQGSSLDSYTNQYVHTIWVDGEGKIEDVEFQENEDIPLGISSGKRETNLPVHINIDGRWERLDYEGMGD